MGITNLTNNGILDKYQAQCPDHASKIDIGNSAPIADISCSFNASADHGLASRSFDINMDIGGMG